MVSLADNKYSLERKRGQLEGTIPDWYTTQGYQLFKEKYLHEPTVKEQYDLIARTAAKHIEKFMPEARYKFFQLLWEGKLSPSTPILANMGNNRGLPVSCSGGLVDDSVDGFYTARRETAILTKYGFGTSSYFGDIRPRGSSISIGGTASGVLPVYRGFVRDMQEIKQGCYDVETEILTQEGWKTFEEVLNNRELKVAQINDDKSIEFVLPLEYFKYEVDEELIHFKDSRNIDLLVTKNHNMVFHRQARISNKRLPDGRHADNRKAISASFTTKTAEEMKLHRDIYFANSAMLSPGEGLTAMDRFLIALQADGCKVPACKDAYSFRFKKQRKIDKLEKILEDLGAKYSKNTYEDGVTSIYTNLGEDLPKTFSWVKLTDISRNWAEEFISELLEWDGNQLDVYYSTIKENADVVQSIACLVGYKCRIIKDNRENEPNKKPIYKVYISQEKRPLFGGENVKKTLQHYKGFVYCVEVPSHKLLVRRNGLPLVCGNSVRRGAFAGYLPISHQDFYELCDYLHHNPDDLNVGWCITDEDISKMDQGDKETLHRYQKALKVKMITGKGYFFFTDKVNRHRPLSYTNNNLRIKASNLCTEITLHSSEDYTFTCVLSSINVSKWDSIVEDDIFYSTIFLHCVALEFIEKASKIAGLEKAVEFTKNGMALGLGQCGFHTLLQSKMLPFESLEAQYLNTTIAKFIDKHSKRASQHLVSIFGEPLWCKGTGLANTHRLAIAPTKSTALIMGGVSEGINPDPAMVYTQLTAAGEVERIAPEFLKLLRTKGKYSKEIIQSVVDNFGSVQHLDFLNDLEKQVFKTAFEIDQNVILRLASQRQKYIDQAQSINLFFPGDASEEYISQVHKNAFKDENILTLYYCYSKTGVSGSKNECTACQ